jgi:hypothetical protein
MKKIIILISVFLISGISYSQPDLHNGASTMRDSAGNWITFNQKLKVNDSLKCLGTLTVKDKIEFDTAGSYIIYGDGKNLCFKNTKKNGNLNYYIGDSVTAYNWYKISDRSVTLLTLDSTGMFFGQTSMQYKINKDTVSDYDANDAVTLHRSGGIITTKSLTTAAGSVYSITLNDSLIETNSIINVTLEDGTNSTAPIWLTQISGRDGATGQITISIYNGNGGASALNGNIKINFEIKN